MQLLRDLPELMKVSVSRGPTYMLEFGNYRFVDFDFFDNEGDPIFVKYKAGKKGDRLIDRLREIKVSDRVFGYEIESHDVTKKRGAGHIARVVCYTIKREGLKKARK